jgi:hypothetical protein
VGAPDQQGSHWTAPVSPEDFHDPGQPIPVSVTGAHGGAGATTVARLLRAVDLGRRWPWPGDGHPPRVLVAARTHARGLLTAWRALVAWRPSGTYLIGCVLVPDAPGSLPMELSRQIGVLASGTMVYQMPWVTSLRLGESIREDSGQLTASLRRFAEQAAMTSTPSLP